MRILFLEPLFPSDRIWGKFRRGGGFVQPIGLMDYRNLVYVNPLLGPDRASAQAKMLELHSRAYRAFYSSPRTVVRNIRTIRSPRHVHRFYKAALAISGLYVEPAVQTTE